jgi:hypothetical protein
MKPAWSVSIIVFNSAMLFAGPPQIVLEKTFQNTVQPFFAKTCYQCHNAKLNTGGFNLEPYQTL